MELDRRTLLAAGAAGLAFPGRAASQAAPEPSPDAIRRDFALLSEAYDRLHPGLDRYLGRARFRALVAAEAERLANGPRTAQAQFLALARITAAVRCGHSYPNPANQSKARVAEIVGASAPVPFAFRWIERRMVVTGALRADVPLTPGTVIDAVDGTPAPVLLQRLLPLARADGANDAKRIALLGVSDQAWPNPFDVYRPLIAAPGQPGRIRLTLAGGSQLDLPAFRPARQSGRSGADAAGSGWSLEIAAGIATLRMDTWAVYNAKWDWQRWIDAAFDRLVEERVGGLVIDLRANEGGLDCGNAILARLVARPLAVPVMERRVRYRAIPPALRPVLDTWDRSFDDWGEAARPSPHPGMFRLVRGEGDLPGATIAPNGRRFAGKVAVLVGPNCSSATFQFAETVQRTGIARLVGEPTGGNRRGINGGAFYFLRLPETGFEVDLPLIGYFPATAQPDAGIVPEVPVRSTAADLAAGRDPALAKARALVA